MVMVGLHAVRAAAPVVAESAGSAGPARVIVGNRLLAPYAASAYPSRGRLRPETESVTRAPFQRDRDRVIHSSAFRRLNYKTQVFLHHEGDHFRTRLTHSLEVAQIARTMARSLSLDEDLAETLALAHDLGHPPFGHAGERALDAAASVYGGFDHNAQSLRVVTELERKYATFDGLNLTWETLEGLVKHNGPLLGAAATHPGVVVPQSVIAYCAEHDLELDRFPSAEAQLAALADDIAYLNHDLDDGLRAGLINISMLRDVDIAARYVAELEATHDELAAPRLIYEVNRRLITVMVDDVIAQTQRQVAALQPASVEDIRSAPQAVAQFSPTMRRELADLKAFLFAGVWRHDRVMQRVRAAETVVRDLFARYLADPAALPAEWRDSAGALPETARARAIVDYVAGMTDRFAVLEHRRLFDHTPELG
jgi:dGTPase